MRHGTALEPVCKKLISIEESCRRVSYHVDVALNKQGKTWLWLAEQLGVHRSRMTELTSAKHVVSSNRLANLAIVLKVSMDWLHRPIPAAKTKENAAS